MEESREENNANKEPTDEESLKEEIVKVVKGNGRVLVVGGDSSDLIERMTQQYCPDVNITYHRTMFDDQESDSLDEDFLGEEMLVREDLLRQSADQEQKTKETIVLPTWSEALLRLLDYYRFKSTGTAAKAVMTFKKDFLRATKRHDAVLSTIQGAILSEFWEKWTTQEERNGFRYRYAEVGEAFLKLKPKLRLSEKKFLILKEPAGRVDKSFYINMGYRVVALMVSLQAGSVEDASGPETPKASVLLKEIDVLRQAIMEDPIKEKTYHLWWDAGFEAAHWKYLQKPSQESKGQNKREEAAGGKIMDTTLKMMKATKASEMREMNRSVAKHRGSLDALKKKHGHQFENGGKLSKKANEFKEIHEQKKRHAEKLEANRRERLNQKKTSKPEDNVKSKDDEEDFLGEEM